MKNKLSDLNNHLFMEIERLGNEDLKGDELSQEIERAKAVSLVGSQIIANASLALKACEVKNNGYAVPDMMENKAEIKALPTAPEEKPKRYNINYGK